MNATFIDPGAAEFLKPQLDKDKKSDETSRIAKRRKYTIDSSQTHFIQVCKIKKYLL